MHQVEILVVVQRCVFRPFQLDLRLRVMFRFSVMFC